MIGIKFTNVLDGSKMHGGWDVDTLMEFMQVESE